MRLIDYNETYIHLLQVASEKLGPETFRRHIKELEISICSIIESQIDLPAPHTGIYTQRLDTSVIEILDLVLHQGYERSDDYGYSLLHHRRHLETDRLASSCRENGKHIPTLQCSADYILLHRSERVIPPIFLQHLKRLNHTLSAHIYYLSTGRTQNIFPTVSSTGRMAISHR